MCKYASSCEMCHYAIEVNTEYKNLQDLTIKVSSECPNLKEISTSNITLDAMHELMVPKTKSVFFQLLNKNYHMDECTLYNSVVDAIGKSLGRYYELA